MDKQHVGANTPEMVEQSLDLGLELKFSTIVNTVFILWSLKAALALVILLILREIEKETFYEYFLEVINDTADGQNLLQGV